jgi:hypothetical protein
MTAATSATVMAMLARLLHLMPVAELIIVMVIAAMIFGPRELLRMRRSRRG